MFQVIERKALLNSNVRYDVICDGMWVRSYDDRILADRHAVRGY